jgi:hypothetical protein
MLPNLMTVLTIQRPQLMTDSFTLSLLMTLSDLTSFFTVISVLFPVLLLLVPP